MSQKQTQPETKVSPALEPLSSTKFSSSTAQTETKVSPAANSLSSSRFLSPAATPEMQISTAEVIESTSFLNSAHRDSTEALTKEQRAEREADRAYCAKFLSSHLGARPKRAFGPPTITPPFHASTTFDEKVDHENARDTFSKAVAANIPELESYPYVHLKGPVNGFTSSDIFDLSEYLTSAEVAHNGKKAKWIVRHGIATGMLPECYASALEHPTLFERARPVLAMYLSLATPSETLRAPKNVYEEEICAVLRTQLPSSSEDYNAGEGSLYLSVLDARVDTPAFEEDKFSSVDQVMETLSKVISGLQISANHITIGSSLTSIAAQVYTFSTIDLATVPKYTRVSLIVGVTSSVVAAITAIYNEIFGVNTATAIMKHIKPSLGSLFNTSETFQASVTFSSIFKLLLSGFIICGFADVGKKVTSIGAAMRGADAILKSMDEAENAFTKWFTKEEDTLSKDAEVIFGNNTRLIAQPIGSFVTLKKRGELQRQLDQNMEFSRRLGVLVKNGSAGESNMAKMLSSNLSQLNAALQNRRAEAEAVGALNEGIRPEPVMINLWGAPGRGKTHFVNNVLVPWLVKTFNLSGKVVNATGSGKDFYPPMADEEILIIDEFLAKKEADPWLDNINALLSQSTVSMDSAFIKNQNPMFRFVITMGNVNPAKFHIAGATYTVEYQDAFRTRLYEIEFDNKYHDARRGRYEQTGYQPVFSHADQRIEFVDIQKYITAQFNRFDDLFETRIAAAREKYQASSTQAIFISFNGPAGSGKSTLARQTASVYSKLLGLPIFYSMEHRVPGIYVLDDQVIENEMAFGRFTDMLDHRSMIITTNNVVCNKYHPYRTTRLLKGYAFQEYGQFSNLHLAGTPRRLGYAQPFIIDGIEQCYPGAGLYFVVENFAIYHEGKHLSTEEVFDAIGVHLQSVERTLQMRVKYLPVLPVPESPHVKAVISQLTQTNLRTAWLAPTADNYCQASKEIIDQLQFLLEGATQFPSTDEEIISKISYIAMRLPTLTAHLVIGSLEVVVDGGIMIRGDAADTPPLQFVDANTGVSIHGASGLNYLSLAEITTILHNQPSAVPGYWMLPTYQKVAIHNHLTENWLYRGSVLNHHNASVIEKARVVFASWVGEFLPKVWDWLKRHKFLAMVAAVGVVAGTITTLMKKSQTTANNLVGASLTEEETEHGLLLSIAIPGREIVRIFRCPDCRSYNCPGCWQGSHTPSSGADEPPVRRQIQNKRETYRTRNANPDGRIPTANHGLAAGFPEKYVYMDYQAISQLELRKRNVDVLFNDVLSTVERATCIVYGRQTGLSARGLFIGDRYVLCNTHLVREGVENHLTVSDDENLSWSAEVHMAIKDRDICLIKVTDPGFPLKKNIQKFFVTDDDLESIREFRLAIVEPRRTTVATGKGNMITKLLGNNVPAGVVQRKKTGTGSRAITSFACYWSALRAIPTASGDCGSTYLAANPALGARRIIAIHSRGSADTLTTYGAVCTQEDLAALLADDSSEFQALEDLKIAAYKHPFHEGAFAAMEPELSMLQEAEKVKLYDIYNTGRFFQHGYSKRAYRPAFSKPDHIPSPVREFTSFPLMTTPAPVHLSDIADHSKLATREGKPSILGTQVKKLAFEPFEMDIDLLNEVEDFLFDEYLDFFTEWRPLNLHEVMNGCTDAKSKFHGLVNGIDETKSAGFFASSLGHTKKAPFLTTTLTEKGKFHHWGTSEAAQCMRERFQTMEELAKEGIVLTDAIEARAKMELLKIEDVATGKVRLFENVGFATFLFHKKYSGAFVGLANKYRFQTPWTIGYNPYTETSELYHRLKRVSDFGEDGDFSRFDKTIPLQVQQAAARLMGRWAVHAKPDMDPTMLTNIFKVIGLQNAAEMHVAEGILYFTNGSFNSGCLETNFGDGLFNILMRYYAAILCHREAGNPLGSDSEALHALKDYMVFFVNGDDIISAIHPEVASWLNFHTLQRAYATFGIMYDLTTKDGGIGEPIRPIENLNFSSRFFSKCGESIVFGALKRSSIERLFHWIKPSMANDLKANLELALLESLFHGPEYYNAMCKEVRHCREQYLAKYGERIDVSVVSYQKALSTFLKNESVQWTNLDSFIEYQANSRSLLNKEMNVSDDKTTFLSRRVCTCGVSCSNQRAYVHHVENSHPKFEGRIPCAGPMCTFWGTLGEFKLHSCEYQGRAECAVCKRTFNTYEAAAHHHHSDHALNAQPIETYFREVHPSIHLGNSMAGTKEIFQGKEECSSSSSPQPMNSIETEVVADLVENHLGLAEKLLTILGLTGIYVTIINPDQWEDDQADRLRFKRKGDYVAFPSQTLTHSRTGLFPKYASKGAFVKDTCGTMWYPNAESAAPKGTTLLSNLLARFRLDGIHQAGEELTPTPSGKPELPASPATSAIAPAVGIGAQVIAADSPLEPFSVATESAGMPLPPTLISPNPPMDTSGKEFSAPASLMAFTGARNNFLDMLYNRYQSVLSGEIAPTTGDGTVIFKLEWGKNLTSFQRKWLSMHQTAGGSFQYRLRLSASTAVAGELFIARTPAPIDNPTLDKLMAFNPSILQINGPVSTGFELFDIRQDKFFRKCSEILGGNYDSACIYVMVSLRLSGFMEGNTATVKYAVDARLGPDFTVNTYLPDTTSAPEGDVIYLDELPDSANLSIDGTKSISEGGTHFFSSNTGYEAFRTGTLPVQMDPADDQVPSGNGLHHLIAKNGGNHHTVWLCGALPGRITIPLISGAVTLKQLEESGSFHSVDNGNAIDSWIPAASELDAGLLLYQGNVPASGNSSFPSTVSVYHYSQVRDSESLYGAIIIAKWKNSTTMPRTTGVRVEYINAPVVALTPNASVLQGYKRALLTARPGMLPYDADSPVQPNNPATRHLNIIARNLANRANVLLPFTLDVYTGGNKIGEFLFTDSLQHFGVRIGYNHAYRLTGGLRLQSPRHFIDTGLVADFDPSGFTDLQSVRMEKFASRMKDLEDRLRRRGLLDGEEQGAAASMIGGGALSGIGQGLSQWSQQNFQKEMTGANYDFQRGMQQNSFDFQRAMMGQQYEEERYSNALIRLGQSKQINLSGGTTTHSEA